MNSWIEECTATFPEWNLNRPCLNLSETSGIWKNGRNIGSEPRPGSQVFARKALVIDRKYSNSSNSVATHLEFFQPEIGDYTVPRIPNKIENIHIHSSDAFETLNLSFESLNTPVKFIEPIIANIFLYNTKRAKRVTESWRFITNKGSYDASLLQLIDPAITNASISASFRYLKEQSEDIVLVCVLDRLPVEKSGMKAYQKQGDSQTDLKKELSKCKVRKLLRTFAFSMTKIPLGHKDVAFSEFIFDDLFNVHSKSKSAPFTIECLFHTRADESSNVMRCLNVPLFPHTGHVNELHISTKTITKRSKSKLLFAEVSVIIPDQEVLTFITHAMPPECEGTMIDTFIVDLPNEIRGETVIKLTVHKAKDSKKKAKQFLSEFVVFKDGVFVDNGEQLVNRVSFETEIYSSVYTTSNGVADIWRGRVPPITDMNTDEIVRHAYSILDLLLSNGGDAALNLFFGVITKLNLSIVQSFCFYYNPVTNFASKLAAKWLQFGFSDPCLFELILKCFLKFGVTNVSDIHNIVNVLHQSNGSRDVAAILKDLFEIYNRGEVLEILAAVMKKFETGKKHEHRLMFIEFLRYFLTPKNFILLNQIDNAFTQFVRIFDPTFQQMLRFGCDVIEVFHVLDDIIIQYTNKQQKFIAERLSYMVNWFGSNASIISTYPKDRLKHVSLFCGFLLRLYDSDKCVFSKGLGIIIKYYLKVFECDRFNKTFIRILTNNSGVEIMNTVIAGLLKKRLSTEIWLPLFTFIQNNPYTCFSQASNLNAIIKGIMGNLDERKLELVAFLLAVEQTTGLTENACMALIARSANKIRIKPEMVSLFQGTLYGPLVKSIIEINAELESVNAAAYPDIYASLLHRKADLLKVSPDARLQTLLQLADFHISTKHYSEAVYAQLTCASLVSVRLYGQNLNMDFITGVHEDLSHMQIGGYCTTKYFSEFGFITLMRTAAATAEKGSMYELVNSIHEVLIPIIESRELWESLQNFYATGSSMWQVIEQKSSAGDRNFGNYYRIQFQHDGDFVYRETEFANLWQVCEKMKTSARFYAKDREIIVQNDKEGLHDMDDPSKYYIHVKAVLPYFDKHESRETVFEQNQNITKFYFDMPFSKDAHSSIEHCWLKRFIVELPHAMPCLESRVQYAKENTRTELFSPIEFCCENLGKQVTLIEHATKKKEFKALQPLLQGSLLVQVNEGPKKMAEVFLTGGQETEHTAALRRIFRAFLSANERAVLVHAEYVQQMPVYAPLQEELELGLSKLRSSLQPYLN